MPHEQPNVISMSESGVRVFGGVCGGAGVCTQDPSIWRVDGQRISSFCPLFDLKVVDVNTARAGRIFRRVPLAGLGRDAFGATGADIGANIAPGRARVWAH